MEQFNNNEHLFEESFEESFEDVEKEFILYFNVTKQKKNNNKKYMKLFQTSKNAETQSLITTETESGFYFPNEIWDYILIFAGYQKISNYEEMLKIDLHILMKSYLHINNHSNKFLIDYKNAVLSKQISFKKNSKIIKKYIELLYNKLLNNDTLKNTLIYFHIKLYVAFLSDYSHNALEINLEIIYCKNLFYIEYQKKLGKSQRDISEMYTINEQIDWRCLSTNPEPRKVL